jgi:hypothetical protein
MIPAEPTPAQLRRDPLPLLGRVAVVTGRIVFMTSGQDLGPMTHEVAYAASKAASAAGIDIRSRRQQRPGPRGPHLETDPSEAKRSPSPVRRPGRHHPELSPLTCTNTGVSDGIRTRDIQDHNLAL